MSVAAAAAGVLTCPCLAGAVSKELFGRILYAPYGASLGIGIPAFAGLIVCSVAAWRSTRTRDRYRGHAAAWTGFGLCLLWSLLHVFAYLALRKG
jgi:hypothetical protein